MNDERLMMLVILSCVVLLGLAPAYCAVRRGHRNAAPIVVLNLCVLAGAVAFAFYPWPQYVAFALLGAWVLALVWSLTADVRPPRYSRASPRRADLPLSCPFCRSLVRPPAGGFDGNAVCGKCGGSFLPF